MSFELLPPPGITEGFNDLETLARHKTPETTRALDALITNQQPGFPDAYQLSSSPEEYAGHLASLLTTRVDGENRAAKTSLIHNSVKLGALLGQQLLRPRSSVISMQPIVREYEHNLEGLVGFVLHGPISYLSDRPALAELIKRYKETITSDTDDLGLVTHVAALTLVHIDMHQFDLYVQHRMRKVDDELRTWQDDLGDGA